VLNGAGAIVSNPMRHYYWVSAYPDSTSTVSCLEVVVASGTIPICDEPGSYHEDDFIEFHAFNYYMQTSVTQMDIYSYLTNAIEFHNSVHTPSQYKKDKEFDCACDKRIRVVHKEDSSLDVEMKEEKVLSFDDTAKLYKLAGEYVKAKAEGQSVEESSNKGVCFNLLDFENNTIDKFLGSQDSYSSPSGLFSAQLRWNETAVNMKLSNSLMPNESSGCGVTSIDSGDLTLNGVYPGLYAVNVSADGYETLEGNISDLVTLDIRAVTASVNDKFRVTNKYQYTNLEL